MNPPDILGSVIGLRLELVGIFMPIVACGLAAIACRPGARASAEVRHLLWLMAFVAMAVSLPVALLDVRVPLPVVKAPRWITPPADDEWQKDMATPAANPASTKDAGSHRSAPQHVQALLSNVPWSGVIAALWLLGFVVQCARFAAGASHLKKLIAHSRPADDLRLGALWNELAPAARLLISSELKVPLVAKLWRPVVILPEKATRWAAPTLRTALLHELAHIERRDLWWAAFARCVTSLFWFHPAAWHALRCLLAEAEMAADDRVILAGASPVAYAEDLVQLVRAHRDFVGSLFTPAMGMLRGQGIEARVARILDPNSGRSAPGRWMRLAALLGAGLIATAILVIRPVASAAPSLTTAPSDLIVRSIEVLYTGEPMGDAKRVISQMHTRAGEPYSEKSVEGDIRDLQAIHHIPIERIFGVPAADGVKIIVVVHTSGTNPASKLADATRAGKSRREDFNPYESEDETSERNPPSFDRNPFRMGRPFHPPQMEPLQSEKSASSVRLDNPLQFGRPRVDYGVPLPVGRVVDETVLVADIDPGPIAATVNGEPITVAEVTNATVPKDRESAEARKASLEKLIDDALILQEAKKRGYTIPDNFIQERITATVDENFHGDRGAFEAALHKQGWTVEKFEQFQWNQIMLSAMKHEIGKSGTGVAAKKQAVADWTAAARAKASIFYK